MKVAGYEWSDGCRFQAGATGTASEVGAHIELLRQQQKGELTPEDVLKDARNNNSPLHSYFEWSDTAAAEQYRLHQARGLIRSVVAVYVSEDRPATRTRAFVHVPEKGAPHYRDAGGAMSSKKARQLVLASAFRELQAWRQRYRELSEFAELFEIVDDVMKKLPPPKPAA